MAITSNGYRVLYKPHHVSANAQGQILEHRMVMSDAIGRALTRKEVVHHIDGNKLNNDLRNLQLLSGQGAHRTVHKKKPEDKRKCTVCGKPERCLQLCEAHYSSMRYHSGLDPANPKKIGCATCGKPLVYRKHIPNQKCRKCFYASKPKIITPCSVCGKPQRCKKLCPDHYAEMRRKLLSK